MPSSESILSGLANLANTYQSVAIGFHAFLAVIVVLLVAGVPLSRRLAG